MPYVAVSDLSDLVISGMANHQLELEELRRMCKKKYCGAPTGVCTFCGKVFQAGYLSFGTRPALAVPSVMVYSLQHILH